MPELTVGEVRTYLSELPVQRVGDTTIKKNIDLASTIVDGEKSAMASASLLHDAKLAKAAHLTMIAYASVIERATGSLPPAISAHLAVLEQLSEIMLKLVKRGAPTYVPMNEQWTTLLEQYQAGELEEDHDYY